MRPSYEQLLALSDDELMDFYGEIELDPLQLRREISEMDDDDLVDEYGLYGDEDPDDIRAELAALTDDELLYEHGSTTPEIFRADLAAFKCLDCTSWLDGEYYMIHDEIWLQVHPADDGMICIGCVEVRLGRKLIPGDFTDALINDSSCAVNASMRLNNRRGHDVTQSIDWDADALPLS